MKQFVPCNLPSIGIAVLSSLAAFGAPAALAGSITLNPGANVQAAVNAAPAGTLFYLNAGTYRMQSVKPKAGDAFSAKGVVDFNGSQVLSFKASGNQYVASAKFDGVEHGTCFSTSPLCNFDQDLFIDNVLQTKATTTENLEAGSWYFNHATNQVYIPTNPEGHTVELGMSTYAFYGSASNVTINGITVEKYANEAQTGALGGDGPGWANGLGFGWVIENCEARFNHGAGAYVGSGDKIYKTYLHHNGQQGIKAIGTNVQIIQNEISFNDQAGFDTNVEGGGGKIMGTNNLLFQSNYVHDNLGMGLWADTDNIYTTYEDNMFVNNENGGLMHEVSYNAVIKYNTFIGNAPHQLIWMEDGQILIQNSPNVEVYDNNVTVPATGGNGITVVNQNRGSGAYGSYTAKNISVYNNTITYLGATGASGLGDATSPSQSSGISFNHNRYIAPAGGASAKHWFWLQNTANWTRMTQVDKQELNGSCCN
jgi:hypothetical protein